MKTTIKLVEAQRIKENGKVSLYIYFGVDSKFKKIPLNIEYYPNRINEKTNELNPAKKDDTECNDLNLIIRKEIGKVNEILTVARISDQTLTIDEVFKQYNDFATRHDFLSFFDKKIKDRYYRSKIKKGTRNSHVNAFIWLKNYRSELAFKDITKSFIESFEFWLQKQENRRAKDKKRLDQNTIANVMKTLKAYIQIGITEGIPIENPFIKTDVKTTQTRKIIHHLSPSEVAFLMQYFEGSEGEAIGLRIALCRFLIACTLSLRISDIMKLNAFEVSKLQETKRLAFFPTKQQINKTQKTIYLPIDELSMKYLYSLINLLELAKEKGLNVSESYARKVLNQLSEKLKIKIGSFHTGRHTFATNFLRAGGKVHNLQQILGHTDIKTTMLYVSIIETDNEDQMLNLSRYYQSFMPDSQKNQHTLHTNHN